MKIEISPEIIWSYPEPIWLLDPPLTDEMVEYTERKLNVVFPKKWIDFLRVRNGGGIAFRLLDFWHTAYFGIGPGSELVRINKRMEDELKALGWQGFVFFDGDGHSGMAFDFRSSRQDPKIVYASTETEEIEPVANSFEEYLSMLHSKWLFYYYYGIETRKDLADVRASLAKILGVEFMKAELPCKSEFYKAEGTLFDGGICSAGLSRNLRKKGWIEDPTKPYNREYDRYLVENVPMVSFIPDDAFLLSFNSRPLPDSLLETIRQAGMKCTPIWEMIE